MGMSDNHAISLGNKQRGSNLLKFSHTFEQGRAIDQSSVGWLHGRTCQVGLNVSLEMAQPFDHPGLRVRAREVAPYWGIGR